VQAVKRNLARFPADFMFQLNAAEWAALRSQSVISNGRGGRRTAPYAFTEQGVAMLSSVLGSSRAIAINIESCALSCGCARWQPPIRIWPNGCAASSTRPRAA
jgi:hypothetical protein